MEYAVGRASSKGAARSFHVLEKPGQKWHLFSWFAMGGNYILMMFYTTICGWILLYTVKMFKGDFVGKTTPEVGAIFGSVVSNPGLCVGMMIIVVVIGFLIVGGGLQKSVEKVINSMMIGLFIILAVLMVRAMTLPGAGAGIVFYLKPNPAAIAEHGIIRVIFEAMAQAAFTLSLGIGSMAIFGSYLKKEKRLMGESIVVTGLDTVSAIMAGFVIFPACFAFGVEPGAGPGLIFVTLPPIFDTMPVGRLWGGLFWLLMTFAGMATTIAVFENIASYAQDIKGWSRKKSCIVNCIALMILGIPCALGFNLWSGFQPAVAGGDGVLGLEDFILSKNLLPLGIVIYIGFCVWKMGWGWSSFLKEANTGTGIKFPEVGKLFYAYILPIFIIVILLLGYFTYFHWFGF
jgi:NSS family neurotransmitter:Na+ symporter